jgi:lipopolysaccharide export LptBFGC system permease protein LptF
MFTDNKIKILLIILLGIFVCTNIYFIIRNTLTPETIGLTVNKVANGGKIEYIDLLKEVAWDREDGFWIDKLHTIQSGHSNRAKFFGFAAILYDNGNTLIIELGEDKKHKKIKASDIFYLEDNLDFLKYDFYK